MGTPLARRLFAPLVVRGFRVRDKSLGDARDLDHPSEKPQSTSRRQTFKIELQALSRSWADWVDVAIYATLFFLFLTYLATFIG
jgi:hypothetical protein